MSNIVEQWFGSVFDQLHPLLQRLHRDGGVLTGLVEVRVGHGVAGIIGRRLARRLGVADGTAHQMTVHIHSAGQVLHWDRTFNGRSQFCSRFTPEGSYPEGYWVESSGHMRLHLEVQVVNGGWHWRQKECSLRGLRLPRWIAPKTIAFKEIRDGKYHFHVEIGLPVVGMVLAYGGDLLPTALAVDHRK